MANDTQEENVANLPKPTQSELFQIDLNALLAKYPTIKLTVQQNITITEKQ